VTLYILPATASFAGLLQSTGNYT